MAVFAYFNEKTPAQYTAEFEVHKRNKNTSKKNKQTTECSIKLSKYIDNNKKRNVNIFCYI